MSVCTIGMKKTEKVEVSFEVSSLLVCYSVSACKQLTVHKLAWHNIPKDTYLHWHWFENLIPPRVNLELTLRGSSPSTHRHILEDFM